MDFPLGRPANEGSNAGPNLDEPLTLKLFEGLADRGSADLEFLGQGGFGKQITGLHRPGHDHLTQSGKQWWFSRTLGGL